MDPLRARQIAETCIPREGQRLDAAGGRIDPAAIRSIDQDGDARITREELARGLEQDLVNVDVSGTTIIDANTVAFPEMTGPLGPNGRPGDPAWFRGGVGMAAPGPVPLQPIVAVAAGSTLTSKHLLSLQGGGFADVARLVQTPADAAFFLDWTFTYEYDRVLKDLGPGSSYSTEETIQRRQGVCRDQHTVARDLLLSNGYQAEMVSYQTTNHSHAVTAYQDPQTGHWGIIEYGKLFPAESVQGRSAEDALTRVRPEALAIQRYSSDGPDVRSWMGAMQYTPLYRELTGFMGGPAPGSGTGVQVDRTGISVTLAGPTESHLQAQVKIHTDPTQPQLAGATTGGVWYSHPDAGGYVRVGLGGGFTPGATSPMISSNLPQANPGGHTFVRVEERHPALLSWRDIGGSGVTATLSSRTAGNMVAFDAFAGDGVGLGKKMLANLNVNPELGISRSFAVGDDKPNLQVRLATGLGFDKFQALMVSVEASNAPLLSSYATATVKARPLPWLGVQVSGYVPVTNGTNDFLAAPAVQATVATPVATLSTLQSTERAVYSAQAGMTLGDTPVTAFASLEEDRRNQRLTGNAGIQASVATW